MLVFKYIKKYWQRYLYGSFLLLCVNLLAAYIPQLIKKSVDHLKQIPEMQDSSLLASLDSELTHIVILILGMAAVMAVIRTVSRWVIFGLGRQVEYDLKKDIFNHLVTLQPSYFSRAGDLISIITNDVQSLRGMAGFAMLNILNTTIAFCLIIPLMYDLNAKLTLYFLTLIPFILLLVTIVSQSLKKHQELVQQKLAEISSFIEENLSAIAVIKSYGQEEAELNRFAKHNKGLLKHYLDLIKTRAFIGPSMKVIASVGFILLLYIGGKSVIDENFSLGDFAAYSMYIERLIWPVATLGWLVTVVYRAKVSGDRIEKVLSENPSIADDEGSLSKTSFENELKLPLLAASEIPVIKKGETVAVVGTIASGKTVFAKKLMHLIELQKGEIFIDDVDAKNIKLKDLRAIINIVPQENFLFSTTILDNILYASDLDLREADEARCLAEAKRLASLVRLDKEIDSFSKGYLTELGERGVTLSGGQRQRLSIARALAVNPEILVLDDALSSVDDKTSKKILKNIMDIRKGKTTIFITHKISIVSEMDKVFVFDGFKVVESGSHKDLVASGAKIYNTLLELMAKGDQADA